MSDHICYVERSTSTSRAPRASRTRGGVVTARSSRRPYWSVVEAPDKEVFHTVVVNYRYSGEQLHTPSTVLQFRQCDAFRKGSPTHKHDDMEDDESSCGPSIRTLYAKVHEDAESEQSARAVEAIKVELYAAPSGHEAVVEDCVIPSAEFAEVIVLSDTDEDRTQAQADDAVPTKLVRRETDRHKQKMQSKPASQAMPKNKAKPNIIKQQQIELHRQRIAVEQKRLELLDVKLTREREEMAHEKILFDKVVELRFAQMRQLLMGCEDDV